jgi:tetratricopeptide (TPR) repeat protein
MYEPRGNEARMANTYHQLGTLAQARGSYDEAARQYQRALDINERLGNQLGMANTYHQLGTLAQIRGDYDEATRQYQLSLDIDERLGNQAGMATSYSILGIMEAQRSHAELSITWHLKALAIRLRLGLPEAIMDLGSISAHRRKLGSEEFTALLDRVGGPRNAKAIMSLLDQAEAHGRRNDPR